MTVSNINSHKSSSRYFPVPQLIVHFKGNKINRIFFFDKKENEHEQIL